LFLIAGRLLDPVTMYPLACFSAWPHGTVRVAPAAPGAGAGRMASSISNRLKRPAGPRQKGRRWCRRRGPPSSAAGWPPM